jgi:Tetratricopeptide repeat
MCTRIRVLCLALIVPIVVSSSHVAQAQWYGGYGGYGGYHRGFGYGGLSYPGFQFGYHPGYLASRAFTAGGVAGSVTYGTPQPAAAEPPPRTTSLVRAATKTESPEDKDLNGELAFRRGDYVEAIENWKTVLDAAQRNPVLAMLLGQAYFAAGNYRESAATIRAAMQGLPPDRWGVVVSNRNELYNDPSSYLIQLQELQRAVHENPNDAAQRFVLAFQYAHLGYPQPALAQLDKVIELDPRDEMAARLRNEVAPRLPAAGAPVITPGVVTPARRR